MYNFPVVGPRNTSLLRFGKFQVDREGHELLLGEAAIALQPKAFDLLLFLIDHRDRLVPKEELLGALWPGVIVMEGSLQRVISLLRQVLRSADARITSAPITGSVIASWATCCRSSPR